VDLNQQLNLMSPSIKRKKRLFFISWGDAAHSQLLDLMDYTDLGKHMLAFIPEAC